MSDFAHPTSKIAWAPNASCAARIAAALFPHSNDLRELLSRLARAADDQRFRNAGLEGLTQMASGDPDTVALLREWASNDQDAEVRRMAVEAIITAAPGEGETLALLHQLASEDQDPDVRQEAVRALVAAAPGQVDIPTLSAGFGAPTAWMPRSG
jgi:hypothetical protein